MAKKAAKKKVPAKKAAKPKRFLAARIVDGKPEPAGAGPCIFTTPTEAQIFLDQPSIRHRPDGKDEFKVVPVNG